MEPKKEDANTASSILVVSSSMQFHLLLDRSFSSGPRILQDTFSEQAIHLMAPGGEPGALERGEATQQNTVIGHL